MKLSLLINFEALFFFNNVNSYCTEFNSQLLLLFALLQKKKKAPKENHCKIVVYIFEREKERP